ncbi:hypothetical protein BpHYR1_032811 [Brachionus plicatilis]|uniref:Uncharacterized protein n=1 Tax=Brachionus plicatilis TaxID=10195 RepID=A0A3M7SGT7_BRAPC|nr:hypothetical protein BpHYR1_032811 [Brachionus plicatilis]
MFNSSVFFSAMVRNERFWAFRFAEFLQRLNLDSTKFVSADKFNRIIFRLKIFVLVLFSKIHNVCTKITNASNREVVRL